MCQAYDSFLWRTSSVFEAYLTYTQRALSDRVTRMDSVIFLYTPDVRRSIRQCVNPALKFFKICTVCQAYNSFLWRTSSVFEAYLTYTQRAFSDRVTRMNLVIFLYTPDVRRSIRQCVNPALVTNMTYISIGSLLGLHV